MFGFDTVFYKKDDMTYEEQLALLKEKMKETDAVLVGAGRADPEVPR